MQRIIIGDNGSVGYINNHYAKALKENYVWYERGNGYFYDVEADSL